MTPKPKTNKYYYDIIKAGNRKEAQRACDVLIKRYKKMQEWGFRFCGDIANMVHLENLRESLREEAKA